MVNQMDFIKTVKLLSGHPVLNAFLVFIADMLNDLFIPLPLRPHTKDQGSFSIHHFSKNIKLIPFAGFHHSHSSDMSNKILPTYRKSRTYSVQYNHM